MVVSIRKWSFMTWVIWGYHYFRKPPNEKVKLTKLEGLFGNRQSTKHAAEPTQIRVQVPAILRTQPTEMMIQIQPWKIGIWRNRDLMRFDLAWFNQQKSDSALKSGRLGPMSIAARLVLDRFGICNCHITPTATLNCHDKQYPLVMTNIAMV